MMINGIKEFINKLKKIQGENVLIQIVHKLYGGQKIKCAFQLLNNEKHLGFLIGEQDIYMEKESILNYGIKGNVYYFADNLMEIRIELQEQ